MPTYEYACKSCGEHLEVVQSFKDDALTTCPACGGPLRKVFGSIGISFKGSGFYRNDSRAPAKAASSSSSGSESKGPSSGSEGSSGSDTKPAASGDKGSGDKGSGDKGSADKGSTTTGGASKTSGGSKAEAS